VLARTTTWTLSRDAGIGLNFTAVNYYDGQGFEVRKSANIKSVKELAGASICVAQGTTNELNLADYFRTHGLKYEVVAFENIDDVVKAYENGRCDALSTDVSQLVSYRSKMINPDEHGAAAADDYREYGTLCPNATIDARHADMLNQLASAPPRQFDRLYGRMQVAAHQEAVALFTAYAQSGEDPSLRAFAQSALPTLQHHLRMARRLPR